MKKPKNQNAMIKINKFLWVSVLSFSIFILAGCGTDKSDKNVDKTKSEVNTELLQEQNDLYEKVCQDFSTINQKVVELNNKMRSMNGKLSDTQNKAIDEIEEKRNSIYSRMHGLKNVTTADWENFKTTLGKDIDDVNSQIDEILNGLK